MLRRRLFIVLFISISQQSFSQYNTYNITSYDIKIIQKSIFVYYDGNRFRDSYEPYYSPKNALAAMQAKFDYYYNLVNSAYSKVFYQELLNHENKLDLSDFKKQLEITIKKYSNVNWAQNSNLANSLRGYFLCIYDKESVKSELLLLQAINSEMNRLKNTYPGRFHKTERYNELLLAIKRLKTCKSSEITQISFDFGLF